MVVIIKDLKINQMIEQWILSKDVTNLQYLRKEMNINELLQRWYSF